MLHWLKTVLFTSAGRWLITVKLTPYFLPSFAIRSKFFKPNSEAESWLVLSGMYKCASSHKRQIGCLLSFVVHCWTVKTILATNPITNGKTSEGTSEKSITFTPAFLSLLFEPCIKELHNLFNQSISSSSSEIWNIKPSLLSWLLASNRWINLVSLPLNGPSFSVLALAPGTLSVSNLFISFNTFSILYGIGLSIVILSLNVVSPILSKNLTFSLKTVLEKIIAWLGALLSLLSNSIANISS